MKDFLHFHDVCLCCGTEDDAPHPCVPKLLFSWAAHIDCMCPLFEHFVGDRAALASELK